MHTTSSLPCHAPSHLLTLTCKLPPRHATMEHSSANPPNPTTTTQAHHASPPHSPRKSHCHAMQVSPSRNISLAATQHKSHCHTMQHKSPHVAMQAPPPCDAATQSPPKVPESALEPTMYSGVMPVVSVMHQGTHPPPFRHHRYHSDHSRPAVVPWPWCLTPL